MTDTVRIALVGIGGYGEFYTRELLDRSAGREVEIVAAIDPNPASGSRLADLRAMGVPLFDSLEAFYDGGGQADLVVVSSPIHFHCPQTCMALEHGSNVLCEKPLGSTVQEARRMAEARDRAGKFVAIGYQLSYSLAVQALKVDVATGVFGRPVRLRALCLSRRDEAYYRRNNWAGALRDASGNWVLDSPLNNATAHYLHHMLYVLGEEPDSSARPVEVVGELYRANNITNYDTAAMRCRTECRAEVLFYTTHAVDVIMAPMVSCEFEDARVVHCGGDRGFRAVFRNGEVREYGSSHREEGLVKLWDAVAAVRGEGEILCGIEAASAQTLCMNGLQESAGGIAPFPRDVLRVDSAPARPHAPEPGTVTWVSGLAEVMIQCFAESLLPAEMGVSWAQAGLPVDLTAYDSFPANPLEEADA